MQMHSTAACTASRPRQLHHPHRHLKSNNKRTLPVSRFQGQSAPQQQQQEAAESSSSNSTAHAPPARPRQADAGVNLPAPQEMQASVMIVPKDKTAQSLMTAASATNSPLNGFMVKCRLAWNLFFPPEASASTTRQLSPKDLGKQRLSMILVADRCGLSPNSLVNMKKNTLAALQDCMELEDLQDAHLRFTMTRENGVTYSMAVPILRPDADLTDAEEDEAEAAEGEYEYEFGDEGGETDAPYEVVDGTAAAWDEGYVGEQYYSNGAAAGSSTTHHSATADALSALADAQTAAAAALEASAAAATAAPARPAGWHSAAVPRASSRAGAGGGGSRGGSPTDSRVTPSLLREMLVEELVHDVEELVEHQGQQRQQRLNADDDGDTAVATAGVLAEQLEAAVAEVQHFGEAAAASGNTNTNSRNGSADTA